MLIIRWLKSHKIRCPEIVDLYTDIARRSASTQGLQTVHVIEMSSRNVSVT